MRSRWATAAATLVLAVLAALTWQAVRLTHDPPTAWRLLWLLLAMWAVFGVGALLIRQTGKRAALWLIIGGGLLLQVVAMTAGPHLSSDFFRYVWDGHVQSAGVNPYLYSPVAPELAPLRDDYFFPPGRTCPDQDVAGPCPIMNRPNAHTIYPGGAQLFFRAMSAVTPDGHRALPLQLAAAVFAMSTLAIMLLLAKRRGTDPRRTVLWAWSPLVVIELGNNAHIDGLAVLLAVAGTVLLASVTLNRPRALLGGALLGLAVATKLYPAALFPSLLKRRPILVVASAAAAFVITYLPYVFTARSEVAGFLPGYLNEEDGSGLAVLRLVLPQPIALGVGIVVLLAVTTSALLRTDPHRPWITAAVTVGVSFIVLTPAYQWYALLLVALIALGAPSRWLILPPLMTIAYIYPALEVDVPHPRGTLYLLAALFVIGAWLLRWWKDRPAPTESQEMAEISP
ncbi:MAG: glycosyltransferase 87 family protein [Candidatus Nanopelagicales bacterium]